MMRPFVQSGCLVLALAACVAAPHPAQQPVAPPVDLTPGWNETEPDTCGVAPFAYLAGGPVDRVHTAGLPGLYRVVSPGMIVTQEYSPQRINIVVDGKGMVTRLTCG